MIRRLMAANALFLVATAMADDTLTIERIFEAPGLSGPSPSQLKISPDSSRVTFIRASESDVQRGNLWEYSLDDNELRLLVDSKDLSSGPEQLSDEELARRERLRISGSTGIVGYDFSTDGKLLLFPIAGDLYVYDLERRKSTRITETDETETDPKLSPSGRYVSFIRSQDLYVYDLDKEEERQLTTDGGGTIKNGMAEFVAQEEMDRLTGYWWAPDSDAIAYARVDESPVTLEERFEVYAEGFKVFLQRYPSTGTPNAEVELGVIELDTGETTWMDLGIDSDIYLARVNWFPDGNHVAVQRQSRDQKTLDFLKIDRRNGQSRTLLTETADTWLSLYNDLSFLQSGDGFIWASERSGFKHLYLYDNDGKLIQPLTAGDWEVTGNRYQRAVLHVDEEAREVVFAATAQSPLERHVYRISFDARDKSKPERISQREGWHSAVFAKSGDFYVDVFQSPTTPTQVAVHSADGDLIRYIEENALDSSHPFAPYVHEMPDIEYGTIKAEDGQDLYYEFLKPADFDPEKKYPVIVYVYGGPSGQRVTKRWRDPLEHIMVNRGFLVFTLDNRGTSFRGVEFDAPIYRRLGNIEVVDQMAGVEFLKSKPYVDADRLGIFGWSYGGYLALMATMQEPDVFAAAVSGAPVTDWTLYDTHYTERFMSTPEDNPEGYEAGSVFPYVQDLKSPLLVIHGMADDNVLFTNSTKLFAELQAQQKDFDSMTYPGSKHSLIRIPGTGQHSISKTLTFFETHLDP
ncbi:MAG: S9 family peptidase [Woeseiaceae bacterium]|nr:S9 family peptidase [Woeseiaceae bacterium]